MATVDSTKQYTPEDLLHMPDGDRYELVDGHLVETSMSALAVLVATKLSRRLDEYCEPRKLGWVLGEGASYQCFPDEPAKVRKPDVSFIRRGRLPDECPPDGHIRLAPDLAVEVVSPNDLYYEVEQKVAEYRAAGVRLIWIVSPPTRRVLIRKLDGSCAESGETGELSGEDVLPGFRCPVSALFEDLRAAPETPPANA